METIEKLSKEKLPMITVLAGEDLGQYSQAKEKFLKQIGFDPSDLTYSYFDMSETDMEQTIDICEKDFKGLCFVNLVDFDALWGHRRNVTGYGEEIDRKSVV